MIDVVGRLPVKTRAGTIASAPLVSGSARATAFACLPAVALEKAAQRKEPTASYDLAQPLFRYLASDPRFVQLKVKLTAQQGEIRTALAQVH